MMSSMMYDDYSTTQQVEIGEVWDTIREGRDWSH